MESAAGKSPPGDAIRGDQRHRLGPSAETIAVVAYYFEHHCYYSATTLQERMHPSLRDLIQPSSPMLPLYQLTSPAGRPSSAGLLFGYDSHSPPSAP